MNTRKTLGACGHALDTRIHSIQQLPYRFPAPHSAQLSGPPRDARRFRLRVDCNGTQFSLDIPARDERTAFRTAAHDIADLVSGIDAQQIRLLSCVEVSA